MGRTGGNDNWLHPRLTVVPVRREDRDETVEALRAHARILDRDELAAALRETCDRRRARDEGVVAELAERRDELEGRRSTAERVLADLTEEQQRTRRAADWCAQQTELDADDTRRVSTSSETLDEHSRVVREANRRLERVLEQRAAAEAAIEDAREHLEGLKAAGFDETGVRRQIEEASQELRAASAEYQEQPTSEAAVERLARARQRVGALEEELTVRSDGETSPEARYEAALELEAQVSSVESRLGEAEVAARAEVDDATRAMTRAELDLDGLRQRIRDRRRHLAGYARLVPDDQRGEVESDPVAHAGAIARSLRRHAEDMQSDRDHTVAALERERGAHEAVLAELEQRRAGLGTVISEDRRELVASLGADGNAPVVLDGVVGEAGGEDGLSIGDLDAVEPSEPLVVLTEDPAVVGWAIELPPERGAVVSAAAIRGSAAAARPAAMATADAPSSSRTNR